MRRQMRLALGLLAAMALAAPAGTQTLTIGLSGSPTSFDPHFHAHAPSLAQHRQVFEPLVARRADLALEPILARSWTPLPSGDGWDFQIDPEARFQDGTPVTASDAAASLERAATIPNSPGRWTPFLAEVAGVEVVDMRRLRIRTNGPAPLLPGSLPTILIVPERIARSATTADFNAGGAAIGSGPYRLDSLRLGERLTLTRDAGWWQGSRMPAQPWARLDIRVLTQDAARVAALLSGAVEAIEAVPPRDAGLIAADNRFHLARSPSARLVYLAPSQAAAAPGLTDARGAVPPHNPLRDIRVRHALSLAINRDALVAQVMQGEAVAAGQFLPLGQPAVVPDLLPDLHRPEEAQRLLAEAGWPDGFRLVLTGPNDRLPNDERILQAVAQMWERVGIRTDVQVMPAAAFFPRFVRGEFGLGLNSWSGTSGEPNTFLVALLGARDPQRGRGTMNPTGYANPRLDALIDRAMATADAPARHATWAEATRLAFVEDRAILPLLHLVNIWGMRRGLDYEARADELTMAMGFRPAPR
ncbi:ABC transporter substrate-binding protein [Roseomonas sp. F4]